MIPGKICFNKQTFNIDKISPMLLRMNLPQIFKIYLYLGVPKAFGRFPRKHSW